MSDKLVIHHNDADGFAAAWVFWRTPEWNDADYMQAAYDDIPPDVTGKDVLVLDFTYTREQMENMNLQAASFLVVDHHGPKFAEIEDLSFCYLRSNRSGAMLAAEICGDRNWVCDYVQDRDLWLWNLPNSKEVNATIASYPHDFQEWDRMLYRGRDDAVMEGRGILRYQEQLVEQIAKNAYQTFFFDDDPVLAVNSCILQSEVGNKLAQNQPFVAVWYRERHGKVRVSLRSTDDGADVSDIAKAYEGNGHKHAAGFRLDYGSDRWHSLLLG